MQDLYERPIKNGESPLGQTLTHAAQCVKCREIKPVADFKAYLTRAQGAARGNKNERRVEIESSMCRACRPRPKPLSKLTAKEMQNRVTSGALHPFIMEKKMEERTLITRAKQAEAARVTAAKRRASHWAPTLQALSAEINKVRDQKKHGKSIGYEEVVAYADTYHGILAKLRTKLRLSANKVDNKPTSPHWQAYMTAYDKNIVQAVWDDIGAFLRSKMRIPGILDPDWDMREVPIDETIMASPIDRLNRYGEGVHERKRPKEVTPSTKPMGDDWLFD